MSRAIRRAAYLWGGFYYYGGYRYHHDVFVHRYVEVNVHEHRYVNVSKTAGLATTSKCGIAPNM